MRILKLVLNVLLAPLVILLAVMLVKHWIATKPARPSRPVQPSIPIVVLVESRPADHIPTIETFGNVKSFHEAQVASQVGGRIVEIAPNFQAGKSVAYDDVLVTIDSADYLAEVARQQSTLATAQQVLAEEESRSEIARQDWRASGRDLSSAPDFTLRKPQLAAAKASVASAVSALDKARLDLERTQVRAPFAAIVQERTASPGNVINSGSVLGSLIARDRAEVRLPLTPEQARRLALPLAFAPDSAPPELTATLTTPSQPGHSWDARLTRTEPSLDTRNQTLFVVAEIEKPFDDPAAFLPIGAFVEAAIAGETISGAHLLPSSALVEDRFVWILDPDNLLRQQPVDRLFSQEGNFIARIDNPLTELPLRIAARPLVSFEAGAEAKPFDPNAPAPTRPKGDRKGQGPPPGRKKPGASGEERGTRGE